MNKKGNVGFVFIVLFGIIISGFLLSVLSPTLNEFRVDLINDMAEHPDTSNILLKVIVYGLIPYVWFMYIILSIFFLIFAVNGAAQNPFG
jgi:uncharacterized BrkB/YihY/UPF0761 family membrane protein